MPEVARPIPLPPTPTDERPTWSGVVHGEVGMLQRTIEQRLTTPTYTLAVIPLPARPLEAWIERGSRAAGWLVLSAAFAGAAGCIWALVS